VGWGPLEELGALFAPGMRHEQQRRKDLEMLRDDEGNAADPPSTVDLDRGVAVLRLPNATTPPPRSAAAKAAEAAAAPDGGVDDPASRPGEDE
jgi:hypothetical protein